MRKGWTWPISSGPGKLGWTLDSELHPWLLMEPGFHGKLPHVPTSLHGLMGHTWPTHWPWQCRAACHRERWQAHGHQAVIAPSPVAWQLSRLSDHLGVSDAHWTSPRTSGVSLFSPPLCCRPLLPAVLPWGGIEAKTKQIVAEGMRAIFVLLNKCSSGTGRASDRQGFLPVAWEVCVLWHRSRQWWYGGILFSFACLLFHNSIYLLTFGCAGSLLLHGLSSSCNDQGLLSSCGSGVSHCSGSSCCRAGL